MKKLSDNYLHLFSPILSYTAKLIDIALDNNKKIIIWGYAKGGRWLQHLIEDYDGRIKVDRIIDNGVPSFITSPNINRSTIFSYLENDQYLVLSTVKEYEKILPLLIDCGYEDEINCYDVYSELGNSYISFLEKHIKGIDFSKVTTKLAGDNNHHEPFNHSCSDVVFEEIKSLGKNLSFFDFGCGLGTTMVYAYAHEIGKNIGGVDINPELIKQATLNMKKLGIECELRCQDATETNVDGYNVFFFYNPFNGKTFDMVIRNIHRSYCRNQREIFIVYGNPFDHKTIVKYGFSLYKQIRVDLYDPILNIYRIGG